MRMMWKGRCGKHTWQSAMTAGVLAATWYGCSVNVEPIGQGDAGKSDESDSRSEATETFSESSSSGESTQPLVSNTSEDSSTGDVSSKPVHTSTGEPSTSDVTATTSSVEEASMTEPQHDGGPTADPCAFEPEDLGALLWANAQHAFPDEDASVSETLDAALSMDAGLPDADVLDAGAGSPGSPTPVAHPELRGWATVPGHGRETTTGGAAGTLVVAKTATELIQYAAAPSPLVIAVCGRIRAPAVTVSSNKTLIGIGPNAHVDGGLHVQGEPDSYVSNVVIKNLEINASTSNVFGFGIRLEYAHHVWLDHLTIVDSREGAIDIVSGSDLVTVSWTRMYHSPATASQEKRFGARVGDVDDDSVFDRDGGRLRVTFHHNHWAERLRQRMPRVAYGQVHLVNNYYSPTSEDYAIWGTWRDASIRVERNLFYATHNPHMLHNEGLGQFPNEEEQARLTAVSNVYLDSSGVQESNGSAFTPPYDFEFDDPNDLEQLVIDGVGPRWPL